MEWEKVEVTQYYGYNEAIGVTCFLKVDACHSNESIQHISKRALRYWINNIFSSANIFLLHKRYNAKKPKMWL